MTGSESRGYHEDLDLFREALSFTQSETRFGARLVEKDYYCSLVLHDLLSMTMPAWAFKGGTCLSKVHSDFYRMSEDLDFAFSVPVDAPRAARSRTIVPMKEHLVKLSGRFSCFTVLEPLRGHNNSTQYVGQIGYRSLMTGRDESIKVEFSVREPILEPIAHLPARTLLMDPFRRRPVLEPLTIPVLSRREAYAEKIRAALTRRDPAIRDFYDIDHAIRTQRVDARDPRLLRLVRAKLAVPGTQPVDVGDKRFDVLKRQTPSQLRPVLRDTEYAAFDLERTFAVLKQLADAVAEHRGR